MKTQMLVAGLPVMLRVAGPGDAALRRRVAWLLAGAACVGL